MSSLLTGIFLFSAILFVFSIKWVFATWNNLTMDELVFHLNAPLEGTNEEMIYEYLIQAALPTLILFFIIIFILIKQKNKKVYYKILLSCALLSIAVIAGVGKYSWDKLKIGAYLTSQSTDSTFIENYYVDPKEVTLTFPEKKRNLIYIYLESMEVTYADKENGGAFQDNVIPELTDLAKQNEDFSGENAGLNGAYAANSATWTMGAMFAHTSGLPLKIAVDGNDMDTQSSFFPGIYTLGDILNDAGYTQTLLIGSDAVFGGRELYFTEHGDYEMMDYNYAKENKLIPKGYKVWWGYEDQKLFSFAKDKLLELASGDEPFNLTMLTVDTHFEDGYVCENCSNEYKDNQYANVMLCSSSQVSEFVSWIQEQDFYEDTTIVIAGDHPTMDKDFCENIDSSYERKVYTNFINAACKAQSDKKRDYTTFDLFPTTLAAMGVNIEKEQLGLGTNLFSKTQTLTERFGIEKENMELAQKSTFMEDLANLDTDSEELKEREAGRQANAD